jgi:hypothetical protein
MDGNLPSRMMMMVKVIFEPHRAAPGLPEIYSYVHLSFWITLVSLRVILAPRTFSLVGLECRKEARISSNNIFCDR